MKKNKIFNTKNSTNFLKKVALTGNNANNVYQFH